MSSTLSKIKAPISKELKEFEKHFKDSMKSNVALIDKITYYIVQRKGKQMRPMFVFLSAKMCGDVNKSTYLAASLIEILHTGTLVHDDVVDDSMGKKGILLYQCTVEKQDCCSCRRFFVFQGIFNGYRKSRLSRLAYPVGFHTTNE